MFIRYILMHPLFNNLNENRTWRVGMISSNHGLNVVVCSNLMFIKILAESVVRILVVDNLQISYRLILCTFKTFLSIYVRSRSLVFCSNIIIAELEVSFLDCPYWLDCDFYLHNRSLQRSVSTGRWLLGSLPTLGLFFFLQFSVVIDVPYSMSPATIVD